MSRTVKQTQKNMTTQSLKNISLRISSGGTPSRRHSEYFSTDSGHLWVKSKELLDSGIDNTEEKITDKALNNSSAKYFPEYSVLIAMYGANVGQLGWLKNPATVNQAVCGLVIDPEKADWRYVFYALLQNRDNLIVQARGAAQQNLNQDLIKDFEILLPPIPTQKQIADVLSAYDDLIENNSRRIQILEQMAQEIYKEWFVNNPKFKNLKVKLSEVTRPQYGYTESANDKPIGPKYLRGTDINKQNFIDWSAVPYCKISDEDKKKYKLQKGDIVIIRMADPGKVGIVEQDIDGVFASYLIRLEIIDQRISPYYLFYFLNSDEYQNYIQGAAGGTTRKSASAGVVTGTNITIPPKELLDQFEEKISLFRSELNNLLNQNANLRQTRDLLLPKLVTGEIRV